MLLESLCCSLPLAKRLKELGIKQGESLFIMRDDGGHVILNKKEDWDSNADFYISVFTASEIGSLIGPEFEIRSGGTYQGFVWASCRSNILIRENPHLHPPELTKQTPIINAETEADARAKMLIHLKEQGIV